MLTLARFLSIRYWLHHRGAFWLSTLGVALGLAVFVAIQIANFSVLAAFGASLDAVTGKANLQIRGGARGLPDDLPARIVQRGDDRIRAAAPTIQKTLFSPTLQTSLLILGVDVFSEAGLRDIEAADEQSDATSSSRGTSAPDTRSGESARFLLDPNAVAISKSLATRAKLKRGSTLEIYSGANRRRLTVTRILEGKQWQTTFGGDFALMDIAAAQENFGTPDRITGIDLIVDEDAVDSVAATLRGLSPQDAKVARPAQRGAEVATLLRAFQLNLSALSCISLFVGAFLVYNAIAISVVRRRSEVGLLRATGAARSQIMRVFLVEAAAIGLVGSILGFGLGILMARGALGAVGQTVSALYISVKAREISVPFWLYFWAPLGGIVIATLSALPAAIEAGAISPRAAFTRTTLHQSATKWAWPVAGIGGLSLVIAVFLSGPTVNSQNMYGGFTAVFFTLAGFSLLTPIVTLWGGRVAQRVSQGVEGQLAAGYVQRALARSSLVVAALMVSLAMSIGMASMVKSFRGSVADWVNATIAADLYIAPANGFSGDAGPGLPPEVIQYARSLPGMRAIDAIRSAQTTVHGRPVAMAAYILPALASGDRKIRFKSTEHGDAEAIKSFLAGTTILVSERFESLIGIGTGADLKLTTPDGEKPFHIAGVFFDYTPNECVLYLPDTLYRQHWHDNALDGVALYLKDPSKVQATIADLQHRFGPRYQLTLLQNGEIRKSVFKTFDQTFAVTYALQLVAIFVAAIGIFDTLIALLLERSRELATLRAIGASGTQIVRMTLTEFALVGLFAWIIGAAAGMALAWQLIYVINKQFFGWTITWSMPYSILGFSLVLSLITSIGAGLIPALAASRRPIASNLQTE